MSRVDPEASNKRLATVKFISNDIDIALFEDLRLRCESLRDPDEQLPTVRYQEAEAWARLYRVYKTLQQKRRQVEQETAAAGVSNSLVEQEWDRYLTKRNELIEFLRAKNVSHADELLPYCGLEKDDLQEPTADDERHGRYRVRGWQDRHSRISSALYRLHNMTGTERWAVPEKMAARRLIETVNSISEKLKTFEEKFDWLDARISAVESKSIDRKH
jgi:hypothetical protein